MSGEEPAAACPACGGPLAPWRRSLARCERCGTAVTVAPGEPAGPAG
ncbi:MAG: hypothetical protein QOE65_3035, partial [Solirubrobacteraceae bacterium]|nr:hypothetical protein [Solirubrobacteraceae bacterium]